MVKIPLNFPLLPPESCYQQNNMAGTVTYNYKQEYSRYRHYFGRIYQFYQKPEAKVSTALLLTIFTTVFFAVFAIRPTLVTIAELLRKIEDQQQILTEMKKKSASLATAQQEYSAAESTIMLLDQAIPQTPNIDKLIPLLETNASSHEVPLKSLSVEEFKLKVPDPNTAIAEEIGLSINANASYPLIKHFLIDLLRLPRLIHADTVTIGLGNNPSDQNTTEQPTISIESRLFNLMPGAKAPALTNE